MVDSTGAAQEDGFPVLAAVARVASALEEQGTAVLVAPPGTGKTTELPPALDADPSARVVLVVPRRMAARAAAARMAHRHGGAVGGRFGYSVRNDRRAGRDTVVEAVTPGLLLRRLQSDPSLEGVGRVILDEFHERSVDLDLLLALLLDVRSALRPDLQLLVMSATLQASTVASVMGGEGPAAPVVEVESAIHPVQTIHRPGSAHDPLPRRVAGVVTEALADHAGDVLAFLPGRGEIVATARELGRRSGGGVEVHELHGSLRPEETDEILAPAPRSGRKRRVVLSTAVAETSLTVPGVRIVVDSGKRRSSEVDPRTGLPGLVTRAVSLDGADQRRGRAGREAPGVCYRLWAASEEETRRRSDPPEVTVADLAPMLLQVLDWGVEDPADLRWLDDPPAASVQRAGELLRDLGATHAHRLTRTGRRLAQIGFHPRLGAIVAAGQDTGEPDLAAQVASVIESEGAGHRDVADAVHALRAGSLGGSARASERQWRRRLGLDRASHGSGVGGADLDRAVGSMVLHGYADRVARRRADRDGVFHMRSGGEVELPTGSPGLHSSEWIVVVEVDSRAGSGRPGRVHLGAALHEHDVHRLIADAEEAGLTDETVTTAWDAATGAVSRTVTRRLGAVTIDTARTRGASHDELTEAVTAVIAASGPSALAGWAGTEGLRNRLAFLAATGVPRPSDAGTGWPDLSRGSLAATAPHWVPALTAAAGDATFQPSPDSIAAALTAELSWEDRAALDAEAPTHFEGPGGRRIRLSYGAVDSDPASALLTCRLQDLIGVDEHPVVGTKRTPITVELLSPARRPLQRTRDLPGFWRGSYGQVRAEMRGRYPKHNWPERPWEPTQSR